MTREQEKGADKNKGQVSFLLVKDSESDELKELVAECEAKQQTVPPKLRLLCVLKIEDR